MDVLPVTSPTPLLIVIDVEPVTVQLSVLDWPLVIERGDAVKLVITGFGVGMIMDPLVDVPAAMLFPFASLKKTLLIVTG